MSIVETIPEKVDAETNQESNECHVDDVEQAQPLTGQPAKTANRSRFNRAYFQQRTQFIRNILAERNFQMRTDQTQLFIILCMSIVAIICSLTALSTNSWMCDAGTGQTYGLWSTCFNPQISLTVESNSSIIEDNQTSITPLTKGELRCAVQKIDAIEIFIGEQSRIDQLTASQAFITCGIIMYILAVVGMALAYKYMVVKNLNYVRNCLVTSMIVKIVSFLLQLIGFYLYILSDMYSTSVGLLFVYFGMAIFSTNVINFITIEYKSFKLRQVASLI